MDLREYRVVDDFACIWVEVGSDAPMMVATLRQALADAAAISRQTIRDLEVQVVGPHCLGGTCHGSIGNPSEDGRAALLGALRDAGLREQAP